jgi:type 1 glutamine amidotransferase
MSSRKIAVRILAAIFATTLFFIVTFAVRARQAAATPPQQAAAPAPQVRPATADIPTSLAGRGRPQSIENGVQIQLPLLEDVVAMEDALPDKAPATPKKPRKILVLAQARGFVHSSIPLAATTVKAMGDKTGAWSTTISYDSADINSANLQQYDLLFLDSTTGAFLDAPNDDNATAARRQALLDFVRSGKGLAGIHAASDSYHTSGGGGGRGRGAAAAGAPGAAQASAAPATPPAPATAPTGTWPEFNNLIGAYFKFHWVYPQIVTVKIDDPKSPLTSMFHGQEFTIHDEIYTYAQDSFSRKNVHVLTSIDYSKMSDEDKAKENPATKRTDGDYALSWIRREGKGRVFYEALGHNEHIYAVPAIMQHVQAGIQYALGDLPADDSPSAK